MQKPMSALPSKADIRRDDYNVRYGPVSDLIDSAASAPAHSRSESRSPCLASESIREAIISFMGLGLLVSPTDL
jgi:hypothetical protein